MSTLFTKLTSRKLWIGVALVVIGIVLCVIGEVDAGLKIVCLGGVGYLGAETICDIVRGIFTQDDEDEETAEEEAE